MEKEQFWILGFSIFTAMLLVLAVLMVSQECTKCEQSYVVKQIIPSVKQDCAVKNVSERNIGCSRLETYNGVKFCYTCDVLDNDPIAMGMSVEESDGFWVYLRDDYSGLIAHEMCHIEAMKKGANSTEAQCGKAAREYVLLHGDMYNFGEVE